LAFNIRPLDTILYTNATFREKADRAIDTAILTAGTTGRPTRAAGLTESLFRYITLQGLFVADVGGGDAAALYRLGGLLGFLFLDGSAIVYLGIFDHETAKEVIFRLKLLLQNLHNARQNFETTTVRNLTPQQVEFYQNLWGRMRAEVVVSKELDKERITAKMTELTKGLTSIPWTLVTHDEIEARIQKEYAEIGEV
jgi:hypothetical protein